MNINAISGNTFKSVETYESYIRYVGPEDSCVEQMLKKNWATIGESVKRNKTKLLVAQRNDEVLINTGTLATRFNLYEMDKGDSFMKKIRENIEMNECIKTSVKGKKKSLMFFMDKIWKDVQGNSKVKFRTLVK